MPDPRHRSHHGPPAQLRHEPCPRVLRIHDARDPPRLHGTAGPLGALLLGHELAEPPVPGPGPPAGQQVRQLTAPGEVHGAEGVHHTQVRGGPRQRGGPAQRRRAQRHVRPTEGLACHERHQPRPAPDIGLHRCRTMAYRAVGLRRRAGQETGRVQHGEQRQAQVGAQPHVLRHLLGGRRRQRPGPDRRLCGHHPHRHPLHPGQGRHHARRPPGTELDDLAPVGEAGEEVADVVDGPRVHRHHRGGPGVQRGDGGSRATGHERQGHLTEPPQRGTGDHLPGHHPRLRLLRHREMGGPGRPCVDVRPTELLDVHHLAGGTAHHTGSGEEQRGGALHHDHEVGQRRGVGGASGRRPQHKGQLERAAPRPGSRPQEEGDAGQRVHAVLDAGPSRVQERHHRHRVRGGPLDEGRDPPGTAQPDRAVQDRGVLCPQRHRATVESGPRREDRVTLDHLGEGAVVGQRLGPLPGGGPTTHRGPAVGPPPARDGRVSRGPYGVAGGGATLVRGRRRSEPGQHLPAAHRCADGGGHLGEAAGQGRGEGQAHLHRLDHGQDLTLPDLVSRCPAAGHDDTRQGAAQHRLDLVPRGGEDAGWVGGRVTRGGGQDPRGSGAPRVSSWAGEGRVVARWWRRPRGGPARRRRAPGCHEPRQRHRLQPPGGDGRGRGTQVVVVQHVAQQGHQGGWADHLHPVQQGGERVEGLVARRRAGRDERERVGEVRPHGVTRPQSPLHAYACRSGQGQRQLEGTQETGGGYERDRVLGVETDLDSVPGGLHATRSRARPEEHGPHRCRPGSCRVRAPSSRRGPAPAGHGVTGGAHRLHEVRALGQEQLGGHEVDPGHLLGDRVLHLQAGVDLQEQRRRVPRPLRQQELAGGGAREPRRPEHATRC